MDAVRIQDQRRWALQIFLWGGFWLLAPFLLGEFADSQHVLRRSIIVSATVAVLVAINVLWLLPKLYLNAKPVLYFLLGVVIASVLMLFAEWIEGQVSDPFRPSRKGPPGRNDFSFFRTLFRLFPYLIAFFGSAAVEMTISAQRQAKSAIQWQKEKLEAEVKWLRWQLNPHFLFNALHNIYALSILKPEKTPDHLLQLSEMMRYLLYESNQDRVPLSKEIEYLERYLALQQLKDSRGLNVKASLGPLDRDPLIAPQLLLPFVENAFKHSNVEDRESGWIKIDLKVSAYQLRFEVLNSLPAKAYTKDGQGGLGLANVRRLLDLTYPGKHSLDISQDEQRYRVCLDLTLS